VTHTFECYSQELSEPSVGVGGGGGQIRETCTLYSTIIIIIPFMQGIHTYVSETNHISRVHSAAAIPRLLLMVHIALSAILNSFVLLH
jgi:hypothetical protein